MLGTTHQIGGICGAVLVGSLIFPAPLSLTDITFAGVMVAGASIGSLMPDLDHPKSKLSRKAKVASTLISSTMGHRGWTHTLLAYFLVTFISILIVSQIETSTNLLYFGAIGLSIGYLSHLILDAFTDSGIPAFKPITEKRLRFASFKTGHADPGVQFLLIAGTIGVLYLQYFK